MQYLFIFVFKSFGCIDEDFFALFSTLVVSMLWILIDILFMISPGKKGINYYMCTGENPRIDVYSHKKVKNI